MRERLDRIFEWLGNTGGPPGWMIQTAQGVTVVVIWIAGAFGVEPARRFWAESGGTVTTYVTATFGLWQVARRWQSAPKKEEVG